MSAQPEQLIQSNWRWVASTISATSVAVRLCKSRGDELGAFHGQHRRTMGVKATLLMCVPYFAHTRTTEPRE
eukprot:4148855-Amphidinium_carterae.1